VDVEEKHSEESTYINDSQCHKGPRATGNKDDVPGRAAKRDAPGSIDSLLMDPFTLL
jgi:hypothetical protein